MTSKSIHEIEFKWTVYSNADFTKFLHYARKLNTKIGPIKRILIRDTYLDAPDGFFALSATKARIRQVNGKWEFTTKSMSVLKKGLVKRLEKTVSLPNFDSHSKAIFYVWTKFLKKSLNGKRVVALFAIQNRRIARKLQISKNTMTEVCFDQVKILRGKKSVFLKEIELEFLKGKLSEFEKFIAELTRSSGLKPAKLSKVATAVKTFKLESMA